MEGLRRLSLLQLEQAFFGGQATEEPRNRRCTELVYASKKTEEAEPADGTMEGEGGDDLRRAGRAVPVYGPGGVQR